MAVRPHLLSLESASTGGVRSIRVDVDEDAHGMHIYRDADYDTAGDCEIAVAIHTSLGTPPILSGAVWNQLQGDGVRFEWPTTAVVQLQIFGRVVGAWNTQPGVGPNAMDAPEDNPPGQPKAYELDVGEDGWLRPASLQDNNFYFSMRQMDVPRAVSHRYTDIDRVKVILRSVKNREAGFDANFEGRLNDAISSAEKRIDAYCGRSFDRAATVTRNYVVRNPNILLVDDFHFGTHVTISEGRETRSGEDYEIRRALVGYNVANSITPLRRKWRPRVGDRIAVTADFGWPEVPAEVVDYAGRLASEIFKFDSAQAGLISTGDGAGYGSTPGKHIGLALRHLRRGMVG